MVKLSKIKKKILLRIEKLVWYDIRYEVRALGPNFVSINKEVFIYL